MSTKAEPSRSKLDWEEEFDDADNTVWVASSFMGDDGGPFRWRVSPRAWANKLVWSLERSDAELHETNLDDDAELFDSPGDAKEYAERLDAQGFADAVADGSAKRTSGWEDQQVKDDGEPVEF